MMDNRYFYELGEKGCIFYFFFYDFNGKYFVKCNMF